MDVRSTASASSAHRDQESAPILIDPRELRSILSNLSHELCRPLASLRAGFDLLLGESPSSITHDQRGHLVDHGLALRRPAAAHSQLSRLRRDRPGLAAALSGLVHDRGADRRDRPPVRPDRFGAPGPMGVPMPIRRKPW